MFIYEAIKTEAEFRRQEWQRAVEADARVAQASTGKGRPRWPHLSLPRVRSLVALRLRFSPPWVPRRCRIAC